MQVTIYLDVVFFVNFITDLLILALTGAILKQKIVVWRWLAGASFGAGMLLPFLMHPLLLQGKTGMLLCAVISLGAVAIAFGRKNGGLIKKWCVSTVILFCLGGIMNGIRNMAGITSLRLCIWLVLLSGCGIGCFFMLRFLQGCMQKENAVYLMNIRHGEHLVMDYVYLDTGNLLWDPLFCKPVIVLGEQLAMSYMTEEEREIVEEYKKKGHLPYDKMAVCESPKKACFHEIVCQSVGNPSGKLLCFLTEEIRIRGLEKTLKRQPVAIAPSQLFEGKRYHGLLHRECI